MKHALILFLALNLSGVLHADEQLQGGRLKPNVLFVVSDDLNYAMSGLGHPECKTPHLDKFAESAVAFTSAYCQWPLCAPSRASMMSGQYPKTNGVTGNGGRVNRGRVTLPRHFQNQGYWTARVSKIYHMGIPVDVIQGTSGRDHPASWNVAHNMMALETMTPGKVVDYTRPEASEAIPLERAKWHESRKLNRPYKMPKSVSGHYAVVEVADEDEHLLADSMAADKAIELLKERAKHDQPFFLAVGFIRPHFPFVATESAIAHYDSSELASPACPEDDYDDIPSQAVVTRMSLEDQSVRELRRGYFGAVTTMDKEFGRLMAELDNLDLRKDTIVVFVSDHGYLLGEHQMWKKTKLWEDAIHVPLFISAPGMGGGATCARPVELVDLYPTLSELAGLKPDAGAQGLSLVPLLADPSADRPSKPDALIQAPAGHCLRAGKWAYMWYPEKKTAPAAAMLFDMEQDPGQFNNLAGEAKHAQTVKRLHQRLMERVKAAGG